MSKLTTDQIFDMQQQAVKAWPQEYQLDKRLPKSSNESGTINAGMCVHIDGNAGFRLGCTGLKMAFFAFKAENNLDSGSVVNPRNEWAMGNGPQGVTALAAVSPSELRTWAFKPNPDYTATLGGGGEFTSPAGTYLVSTDGYLAAAGSTGVSQANLVAMSSGPVQPGNPMTNMNRRLLPFYPVHLPARAAS